MAGGQALKNLSGPNVGKSGRLAMHKRKPCCSSCSGQYQEGTGSPAPHAGLAAGAAACRAAEHGHRICLNIDRVGWRRSRRGGGIPSWHGQRAAVAHRPHLPPAISTFQSFCCCSSCRAAARATPLRCRSFCRSAAATPGGTPCVTWRGQGRAAAAAGAGGKPVRLKPLRNRLNSTAPLDTSIALHTRIFDQFAPMQLCYQPMEALQAHDTGTKPSQPLVSFLPADGDAHR